MNDWASQSFASATDRPSSELTPDTLPASLAYISLLSRTLRPLQRINHHHLTNTTYAHRRRYSSSPSILSTSRALPSQMSLWTTNNHCVLHYYRCVQRFADHCSLDLPLPISAVCSIESLHVCFVCLLNHYPWCFRLVVRGGECNDRIVTTCICALSQSLAVSRHFVVSLLAAYYALACRPTRLLSFLVYPCS